MGVLAAAEQLVGAVHKGLHMRRGVSTRFVMLSLSSMWVQACRAGVVKGQAAAQPLGTQGCTVQISLQTTANVLVLLQNLSEMSQGWMHAGQVTVKHIVCAKKPLRPETSQPASPGL